MTTKQFCTLLAVVVIGFVILAAAQSYGGFAIGPIAPTVTQCPPGVAGQAVYCPVGSSTLTYSTYVSYNAGAYMPLVPASSGPALTATDPIAISPAGVVSLNSDAALHTIIGNLGLTATVPANTIPTASAPVK